MSEDGRWNRVATKVLATVFHCHGMPPESAIREAYPFGERGYWPYKVWLREVKRWKQARAKGLPCPTHRVHHVAPPPNPDLFEERGSP